MKMIMSLTFSILLFFSLLSCKGDGGVSSSGSPLEESSSTRGTTGETYAFQNVFFQDYSFDGMKFYNVFNNRAEEIIIKVQFSEFKENNDITKALDEWILPAFGSRSLAVDDIIKQSKEYCIVKGKCFIDFLIHDGETLLAALDPWEIKDNFEKNYQTSFAIDNKKLSVTAITNNYEFRKDTPFFIELNVASLQQNSFFFRNGVGYCDENNINELKILDVKSKEFFVTKLNDKFYVDTNNVENGKVILEVEGHSESLFSVFNEISFYTDYNSESNQIDRREIPINPNEENSEGYTFGLTFYYSIY